MGFEIDSHSAAPRFLHRTSDRAEYVSKRDAIDAELDALAIGPSVDLDGASAVLEDFGRFRATELSAELRRELLARLFDRVWIDGRKIVAVRPTAAFTDLFVPGNTNTAAP